MITFYNYEPKINDLFLQTIIGLQKPLKELPDVLLYDEQGEKLYDRVCASDEYYLTRTEIDIMYQCINDIARLIGDDALLIEYGSGSSLKTHMLLDSMPNLVGYVPIDISKEHLLSSAQKIAEKYLHLEVMPVCADYMAPLDLPSPHKPANIRLAYYPGSTIGHLEPPDAFRFLSQIKTACGDDSGLLIGVDLKKDDRHLLDAYNNKAVSDFVINILAHINHKFGANFVLNNFRQQAFYNSALGRVEVYLISNQKQTANMKDKIISFQAEEKIKISHAYKYSLSEFEALAAQAGWKRCCVWHDRHNWFSVQYFVC